MNNWDYSERIQVAEMVLCERSKAMIGEIFGRYTPIDKLPDSITEKIVIHMYPTKDTLSDDPNVYDESGYDDALLFEAKFYLTESKRVYSIQSRDSIEVRVPAEVKIFKDGSTMVVINALQSVPLLISLGQAIAVWRKR